jgi:RNA polymerase sigma-70 factor (ECF subfamily)
MESFDNFGQMSDFELCQALTSRKEIAELAFTEIYNRYSQMLFAFILRILGNRTDAKDVFQETFLKFYSSCVGGAKVTNILPLLLKIARNLCLNRFRDKKMIVPFEDNRTSVFDEELERSETSQIIANALALLDFPVREIFVLHHYQSLTFAEIAEITGESLATVKTRYYRALEKLRNYFFPFLRNEK